MKIHRSFWKYNIDNWPGIIVSVAAIALSTMAFILGGYGGKAAAIFFGAVFLVNAIASIIDWKKNG